MSKSKNTNIIKLESKALAREKWDYPIFMAELTKIETEDLNQVVVSFRNFIKEIKE